MRTLRIALAQINCTVGALDENSEKICEYIRMAKAADADLVAFPEMAVTGYPPEDLLLKPHFIDGNLKALDRIARATRGISAVVGFVDKQDDIYNAAAVIHNGSVRHVYHKQFLPNYGVFDEERYFREGTSCGVGMLGRTAVGINICEDIWHPEGPTLVQALLGDAEVIVNINASPYHRGKYKQRRRMLATRARDNQSIIAYVNLVGGQDELIFDGMSMILDQSGKVLVHGPQFREELVLADLQPDSVFRTRLHDSRRRKRKTAQAAGAGSLERYRIAAPRGTSVKKALRYSSPDPLHPLEEVYQALVMGIRDYVGKNGFSKVVIGLSGGVDSSLVAVLAVDALGAENVAGVFMPSPYTSAESDEDAHLLAGSLGIRIITIPILPAFDAYREMLAVEFRGKPEDVTEENLQARIRGNLLMALSNKFGWLVLTTGNKSEMSVGYATLYGDMAGGFAVVKDVPKTLVYELSRFRNTLERRGRPGPIPLRVIKRAPTAELRPGQTDQDSLPPYEILDPIIQAYVEEDRSIEEITAQGYDPAVVRRVIRMIDASEYKRRQAPIGIKITPRAFGKDRRVPITTRFKESPRGRSG
jgi:NAD+ synthase (glutamine-hydrolysing)